MKSALFAVALLCGGAAIAQTEPQTPMATTATPTSQTVAPGNTDPELDARGIPVVSDPATSPPGFNQGPAVGGPAVDALPTAPPAPQPATESYPACSRTVTDNCVQTYERGRSPNG